jgi:hypothetical protein
MFPVDEENYNTKRPATAREMLQTIQEWFRDPLVPSIQKLDLHTIFSAVRGPDNRRQDVKDYYTSPFRERLYGKDFTRGNSGLSTLVLHPIQPNLDNVDAHFKDHIDSALDFLNTLCKESFKIDEDIELSQE